MYNTMPYLIPQTPPLLRVVENVAMLSCQQNPRSCFVIFSCFQEKVGHVSLKWRKQYSRTWEIYPNLFFACY